MVLASGVAAPEIRCGFNPERRPQDAQGACIPLRWSITQFSDVDQRGNETAFDKTAPSTVPATNEWSFGHDVRRLHSIFPRIADRPGCRNLKDSGLVPVAFRAQDHVCPIFYGDRIRKRS